MPALPTPAVAVDDLTKRYGEVRALDAVSLAVEPGEIFGLLGPNGAGKSTMIRILTGRAKPTSGHARVLGHEVRASSKRCARRSPCFRLGVPLSSSPTATSTRSPSEAAEPGSGTRGACSG